MRIHPRPLLGALLVAATIAGSGSGSASACGEVMYRMGGALRYQAFVTRHPANILLYGGSEVAGAPDAEREGFRQQLEKAGHKVTVAANADAFELALATHAYDIVITRAGDVSALQPALARAQHAPSLIPVIEKGGDKSLRRQYPQALAADAGLNRFLKNIERTMQTRGS